MTDAAGRPASLQQIASCVAGYDPDALPVAQAQDFIARLVSPVRAVESRPIRDALGRVLARDVVSAIDVPAHDNSAMDGYALRGAELRADAPTLLRVVGSGLAGLNFDGDVPPQRNGFAGNRNVDSANVSRVEIVKGPASLLYGQIIPGGTVNYITKRPEKNRFVSIRQSVGNYSDFRTVVDANLPVNEWVGFRVVGSYDQAPQWAVTGETESWLIAPSMKLLSPMKSATK